jgi:hypothetical protein
MLLKLLAERADRAKCPAAAVIAGYATHVAIEVLSSSRAGTCRPSTWTC